MRVWKVLALGAIAACGDDSEGGSSAIDGKKVSELTGAELGTFCEWLVAQEKKSSISDEQYCTLESAQFSESKEECEEYRDECLADLEAEDDVGCDDFPANKACDVTVKAFKTCLDDWRKRDEADAKKASCDKPGNDSSFDELPDSCVDIPDDCFEVEFEFESLRKH